MSIPNQNAGVLAASSLDLLFKALKRRGYKVVGPTVEDGAIVLADVASPEDLPVGLIDKQEPGHYRLLPKKTKSVFDYVVGPQNWKKYLFPSRQKLWSAKRKDKTFVVEQDVDKAPKYAFLGVRACDVSAIEIQDKIFGHGDFADPGYLERRKNALIIAVNCAKAASTCFCTSQGTGPKAESGYDLALTEIPGRGDDHRFLIEAGSQKGRGVMKSLALPDADEATQKQADKIIRRTAASIKRKMPDNIEGVLKASFNHDNWEKIAERCLNCANCTMVCPTCFCTTVEDVTDLTGNEAERWRLWDSCFTVDFSYIHGGAIRREGRFRYRQWMTHKLAHWHDQFDTSGCTGCGRCITWCPVGIDITEEARLFAGTKKRKKKGRGANG